MIRINLLNQKWLHEVEPEPYKLLDFNFITVPVVMALGWAVGFVLMRHYPF